MHIHHLNCGSFCPLGKKLFNGTGSLLEKGLLVCHCQLVEGRDGLILIDTGLGTQDIERPDRSLPGSLWRALNQPRLDFNECAVTQIRRMGFRPEDVRHIVLTHLDFDHAGGLPDFPDATVHVYQRELEAALERGRPRDRMRYTSWQFSHHPRWQTYTDTGDSWFGFKAVRNLKGLPADILLIPLPGHTRGHCGVAINTEKGWLLNCGDAAFYHGELDSPERHCPMGLRIYQNIFQYHRQERLENQRRLRELAQGHVGVQIFCSHDPEMMHNFAGKALLRPISKHDNFMETNESSAPLPI